ncbi:hypothetical protein HGA92_05660 [Candidatus Gracilibacteria bacterium]|nr:hypothetical protein [Candidatus Gracilibacteria bacterium]NUJ98644.1 hypothetical protein [Candidatus Gracilibacteria bacterium]
MWQDFAIMTINIIFSLSLVPQVIEGFKKKKGLIEFWTSIPTTLGLFVMSYTFLTLNLIFSAILTFLTGILWFMLLVQKIIFKTH